MDNEEILDVPMEPIEKPEIPGAPDEEVSTVEITNQ